MKLPPKSSFSEWFNEIIFMAEIMDVRYPVKGLYVWMPFGFKLRREVYGHLKDLLDREHDEVLFPLLVPESEFMKEAEHIKGFEDEVYWVTHGGKDELDIKLVLRPTSETAMYPMFKLWVRTHADLPLRVYQVVNIFRYETKHTRPLIRLREVTSFKEAHTVHSSYEDAENQVKKAIALYKEFYDSLCLPYLIFKRPDWDKFPGADYTIALDTIMPDGRTLQIGTAHNLGNNFAKTYDITFENVKGEMEYAYQTCYGISERCIAALIAIHGDDRGLVMPFRFAPIQAVVIPVLYKDKDKTRIMERATEILDTLKNMGIRAVLDDSEDRPGAKYYQWELKGVPVRIEIGAREIEHNTFVISFRDEMKKETYPMKELENLPEKIEEYDSRLRKKAWENLYSSVIFQKTLEDVKKQAGEGLILIHWCGGEDCGEKIEDEAEVSLLGELVEKIEDLKIEPDKCIVCGKETALIAGLARTY